MTHSTDSAGREFLKGLFSAAIDASRGDRVIRAVARVDGDRWIYAGPGEPFELALPGGRGRVVVIGAGKAAASMAAAMEGVLGDRLDSGLVIVKSGGAVQLQRIVCREGGHPVPDDASVQATRELLSLVDGVQADDTVFLLLSGGASSLLCLPIDGITLDEKATAHRLLVNSGASIAEINTDLPEPVVPATSRCGMRARSAAMGSPETSRPRAMPSCEPSLWNAALSRMGRMRTVIVRELGTSMPTYERPGTGAWMRRRWAERASARSRCRAEIWATRTFWPASPSSSPGFWM